MKRALLLAALAVAGCKHHEMYAQVQGATLPECDDSVAAPDGPTVVVLPSTREGEQPLPTGPIVRIAADRAVAWRRVAELADRVRAQGSKPVFLVGRNDSDEIAAFEPTEPLHAGPHMYMDVGPGQFYFGTAETGTDVRSADERHITKSSIHDEAAPLVKQSGIHDVEVRAKARINWADAVRAVDGARTCCPGVEMRASLQPPVAN